MTDYSTLKINKLIIHEVPKINSTDGCQPTFSEIESSLKNDNIRLLINKIVSTIGSNKAYDITFDPAIDSPIPYQVMELFNDETKFLQISKEIALHLSRIQDRRNSSGFIFILLGENEEKKIVGILKIEMEEGARAQQTLLEGKMTYDIVNIKDLILTKNTSLYKVSIFHKQKDGEDHYTGKVCDNQISVKGEIANFFLQKFLGCKLIQDPQKSTKDFFDASENYIIECVNNPRLQCNYKLHLLSYLSSNINTINPDLFANTYLESNDKPKYIRYLKDKGVDSKNIIRDISSIENRLKQMKLFFENGISIIGSQKAFKDDIKIEELDDGKVKAEVISKLKKL